MVFVEGFTKAFSQIFRFHLKQKAVEQCQVLAVHTLDLVTAGIQTASGDGMSNTSVKDMIADIFKAEDAAKPLSDQEVVRMLKEKGIVIARRTVAKYRTELNILPSNLRKVY